MTAADRIEQFISRNQKSNFKKVEGENKWKNHSYTISLTNQPGSIVVFRNETLYTFILVLPDSSSYSLIEMALFESI